MVELEQGLGAVGLAGGGEPAEVRQRIVSVGTEAAAIESAVGCYLRRLGHDQRGAAGAAGAIPGQQAVGDFPPRTDKAGCDGGKDNPIAEGHAGRIAGGASGQQSVGAKELDGNSYCA